MAKIVRRKLSKPDVKIRVKANAAIVVGTVTTMIGGPSIVLSIRNTAVVIAAMTPTSPTSLSLQLARDKVNHQSNVSMASKAGTKAPTIQTIGNSGNHPEKYRATIINKTRMAGIQIRKGR